MARSEHSASDRMKRFLEDKDWKFYTAVAAGVVVAGAGVYYIASLSGRDAKQTKSPQDKKKEKGTRAAKQAKETPAPATAQTGTNTADSSSSTQIEYESWSDSDIAALSPEKRAEAAQTLKTKGNSQFTSKNYAEAARLYTQAIRFKADAIFFANRAACYANLGEHDQVIEDCNEALKLDSMYVKALNRRAVAFEKTNRLMDAVYDYTCVCILDGFKNENAAKSMERVLKRVAEEKATELMKSRKARLPSLTFTSAYFDSFRPLQLEFPAGLEEGSGDAAFATAYRAIQSKDFQTALEACEKAIELGCSRAYQAYTYNLMGTFEFLKGDPASALTYFNTAIEADPNYTQSYIKRSSLYMEQGDIATAFKQFDDALAINPSDPDVYYHRGQVTTDAASKDYTESLKLDDTFVYAHIQLGVVQYKLGSISSAMSTFNKTLKTFPQSADVQNYYGELLMDQQKMKEAMEAFSKAIELDPKSVLPYINKAMLVYQALGDTDEAIALCKTALQYDPAADAAVASLAQILLDQSKPEEALKYYEMAIDLARTQPELEHAISYVEATKTQIRFSKEYPEAAAKLRATKGA